MSRFPEFRIDSRGTRESSGTSVLPEVVAKSIEISSEFARALHERHSFLVAEGQGFLSSTRFFTTPHLGSRRITHVVGGLPANISGRSIRRLCESGIQFQRIADWKTRSHAEFEQDIDRILSPRTVSPLPELSLDRRHLFHERREALRDGDKEVLLFVASDWPTLSAAVFQFLDGDDSNGDERSALTFSTFEQAIPEAGIGVKIAGVPLSAFDSLNGADRELLRRRAFIDHLDAAGQIDVGSEGGEPRSANRPERPQSVERRTPHWREMLASLSGERRAAAQRPATTDDSAPEPGPFPPERLLSVAARFSERTADLSLLRSEANDYLVGNSSEPIGTSLLRLISVPEASSPALACALGAILDRRPDFDIEEDAAASNQIDLEFAKWQFEPRVLFLCLCVKSAAEQRPNGIRLRSWVEDVLTKIETSRDYIAPTPGASLPLVFALLGIIGRLNLAGGDFSQRAQSASDQLRLGHAPNVSIIYRTVREATAAEASTGQPAQLASSIIETIGFPDRLQNSLLADVAVMAIWHETGIDVRSSVLKQADGPPGSAEEAAVPFQESQPAKSGLLILRRLDKFRQRNSTLAAKEAL